MSEPIGTASIRDSATGDRGLVNFTHRAAFAIPGEPQPKQRARRGKGGRWYTPEATRAYEKSVKDYAMQAFAMANNSSAWPTDRLYRLEVHAVFGSYRRADADNVLKAVSDALNKLAWADDVQVVQCEASRSVSTEPATHVIIYAFEQKFEPAPKRRKRAAR